MGITWGVLSRAVNLGSWFAVQCVKQQQFRPFFYSSITARAALGRVYPRFADRVQGGSIGGSGKTGVAEDVGV